MRILLTGATGYVGGRLAPRLIAEGHELRCLARDPARLAGRPWGAHEVVAGDVSNPESLRRALDGCDAAYYLVHSMTAGEKGFEDRDRACARIFADAVKSTPSLRRGMTDTVKSKHFIDLRGNIRTIQGLDLALQFNQDPAGNGRLNGHLAIGADLPS